MVREAIRYQDSRGRDHKRPDAAASADLADFINNRIVLSAGIAEQIASVIIRDMGSFLPIILDLQAYNQRSAEGDQGMALYPFKNKETEKITLVSARSKERAAQVIAGQTYEIGDPVSGEDTAAMMAAGADYIKDGAEPEPQ